MLRLGITGTDTGVGKTFIASAIAAHLRQRGQRVAVMKPVETGVETQPADAVALRDAAGSADSLGDICPYTFREPLAPLVAAERSGTHIDLAHLDATFARLARDRDAIIVEGAGGLLVPIAEGLAYDRLFHRWNLDIVIVAANRLGVINHVMLTHQATQQAGLHIRAIVLNTIPQHYGENTLAEETNLEALRALLPLETIVSFPGDELVQLF